MAASIVLETSLAWFYGPKKGRNSKEKLVCLHVKENCINLTGLPSEASTTDVIRPRLNPQHRLSEKVAKGQAIIPQSAIIKNVLFTRGTLMKQNHMRRSD